MVTQKAVILMYTILHSMPAHHVGPKYNHDLSLVQTKARAKGRGTCPSIQYGILEERDQSLSMHVHLFFLLYAFTM
jgi:hypothetical protein